MNSKRTSRGAFFGLQAKEVAQTAGLVAIGFGLLIGLVLAIDSNRRILLAQSAIADASLELADKPLHVVYVNDTDDEVTRQYETGLSQAGVVVVNNFDAQALADLAQKTSIDAVIFDASLRKQLDWGWMKVQLLAGKPIIGLGMSVKDIYTELGMPVPKVYDVDSTDASNYFGFVQLFVLTQDQATLEETLRRSESSGLSLADLDVSGDLASELGVTIGYTHLSDKLTTYGPATLGKYLVGNITTARDWRLSLSPKPENFTQP